MFTRVRHWWTRLWARLWGFGPDEFQDLADGAWGDHAVTARPAREKTPGPRRLTLERLEALDRACLAEGSGVQDVVLGGVARDLAWREAFVRVHRDLGRLAERAAAEGRAECAALLGCVERLRPWAGRAGALAEKEGA